MENPVTQQDGIKLCGILWSKLNDRGYFPALTGGLLYKEGERKDIDIVIYRHRQKHQQFEMTDIFELLEECGLYDLQHFGFVTKAKWRGVVVDLFNPESVSGADEYESGE